MVSPKFKHWYDEKEGVLRGEIYERFNADTLEELSADLSKYTPQQQEYIVGQILDNAQQMPGKEERKLGKEKAGLVHFKKAAIWGAKPVIRMVASIVLSAQGRGKDVKFFVSEEEALAWIRTEKEKEKTTTASQG